MNDKNQTVRYTAIFCCVFFCLLLIKAQTPGGDFIQYVAAIKAFLENKNPYDAQIAYDFQQSLVPSHNKAMMFWAPPWMLVFILPIQLVTTYTTKWIVFLGITTLFFGVQFYEALRMSKNIFVTLLSIMTVATYSALHTGNAVFIPGAGMSLFILGMLSSSSLLAALGMILLSTKPHLFILFFLCTICLRPKDFYSLLKHAVMPMLLMLLVTSYFFGYHSIIEWKDSITSLERDLYTVPRFSWICANLDGVIRKFFDFSTDLRFLIVLSSNLLLLGGVFLNRKKLIWEKDVLWLLPLCLFIAPYGWLFDAMLLQILIAHGFYLLKEKLPPKTFWKIVIFYALFQCFSLIFHLFFAKFHHDFWWYELVHAAFFMAVVIKSQQVKNLSVKDR